MAVHLPWPLTLLKAVAVADFRPSPAPAVNSGKPVVNVQLVLAVAENTVKRHVQNILRKLGARSRTEVVARLRRGQF